MRVFIPNEGRYLRTADGAFWSRASSTYAFWQRYLDVFDGVSVVARVKEVNSVPANFSRADGPGVEFQPLPYYKGPWGYARHSGELKASLSKLAQTEEAVILRAPGRIASLFQAALSDSRPYGVEVIGDPYDLFGKGTVRHLLRPFFRRLYTRELRRIVNRAVAVSYVTEQALQRRYPAPAAAYTASYSSIELQESHFVSSPRTFEGFRNGRPINCLTIGSLELRYKGTDVLLSAVAYCRGKGLDVSLTVVGDGKLRPRLEKLTQEHGISSFVRFTGQLPAGDAVRCELDAADLFVLPSRSEGLPRAMIEAMARGLPCIGTRVGGIPELLQAEYMVPVDDSMALGEKIIEVAKSPGRMAHAAVENLDTARRYRSDALKERRNAFYQCLKEATSAC